MTASSIVDFVLSPELELAKMLIGGQWTAASEGGRLDVENPSRRVVLASVPRAGTADVDNAVGAARRAFPGWQATPARERGIQLLRIADDLEPIAEELARIVSAETGNALRTQTRGEVSSAGEVLRYFGSIAGEQKGEVVPLGPDLLSYSLREPLGVVAAIVPWNAPVLLASLKIGMALATGNTVVLKPAEDAPLGVLRLAHICDTHLPPGVLNVLTGYGEECGEPLLRHPDISKISFTGSTEVGRIAMHAAADRVLPVSLELGGKAPSIVFPDSNDLSVVDAVISAMRFARQGQSCTAGSRLYVHASIFDAFLGLLTDRLEEMKVGDALDEASDIGSIVSSIQDQRVCGYIEDAVSLGANILTGGLPVDTRPGYQLQPTVISHVDNAWRIAREEVFGPVMLALPWTEEDEVIKWANDSHYGLAAFVFSRDLHCALRTAHRLESGWVQINRGGGQLPGMSYGGKKESGLGAEYSLEGALEAYTQRKSVTVGL